MNKEIRLRPTTVEDAPKYIEHLQRHFAESGKDDLIFHPMLDLQNRVEADEIKKIAEKWAKKIPEEGSRLTWIAETSERIIGHVDLSPMGVASARHRLQLGMGLEKPARGYGWGTLLLKAAIRWSRENAFDWIDLDVFAHNEPALKLYSSQGFQSVGTTKDLFRIGGKSIDDIHMTLDLRGK